MAASVIAVPLMLETRLTRPERDLDDTWKRMAIRSRGQTLLGISFRPRQAEDFGLPVRKTLETLLRFPFDLIRIAAYWNQIESRPGDLDVRELDWQLEAAERAGKRVIVSVGAIKNFGYPEVFVPGHHLELPLVEGSLVRPATHPSLLSAAIEFIRRIVARYRDRASIVAWQLEHEAVDPLGMEHSWRLGVDFVERELEALRDADGSRPVMMNGFLPTSSMVRLTQWWRTRDQGDSRAFAIRSSDIVGIDYYPRHALLSIGQRTLYLTGSETPWQRNLTKQFLARIHASGKRVMIAEGQAEPWETVTRPPNPPGRVMFSCRPEDIIANYNEAIAWALPHTPIFAYLFWGAEYWLLRDMAGDQTYLRAFWRITESP
jgi:hypothetical protein